MTAMQSRQSRRWLLQIGGLARHALAVLGNDTGPAHIAASAGAPVLTLFAAGVDPVWSQPRGACASMLQGRPLAALPATQILEKLAQWVQ